MKVNRDQLEGWWISLLRPSVCLSPWIPSTFKMNNFLKSQSYVWRKEMNFNEDKRHSRKSVDTLTVIYFSLFKDLNYSSLTSRHFILCECCMRGDLFCPKIVFCNWRINWLLLFTNFLMNVTMIATNSLNVLPFTQYWSRKVQIKSIVMCEINF